jgi:hypothetical protein
MKRILAATALIALAAGTAQAEFKTPAIDGTGITAANNGPSLALQTATPGFGPTLQLGEVFVSNDGTNLYVSFAGNNDNGGSGIYLFLNTVAGGATNIAADPFPGYGEFNDLADVGGGNMPAGFGVDYILNLKRPAEGGSIGLWNLATNTAQFIGNSGSYTLGFNMAQDNSNATFTPWASGAVTTGVEVQIPLSQIGNPGPGDVIQFFAIAGNNNKGGNGGNYMSNQLLPNVGTPGNYGSDGSGGGGGGAPGLNYNGTGGPNVVPLAYTVKAYGVPYAATGPGTSTIGPGGTYPTLRAAVDAINAAGSRDGSQWIFEFIGDTTEPENAGFGIPVDPAGGFLFRPAAGVTATVTFTRNTDDNAGPSGQFVLGGQGATIAWPAAATGFRNVTIDGNNGTVDHALTFRYTGTAASFQSPIAIVADASNIVIRNTVITNATTVTGASMAGIAVRPRLSGANNLFPTNFLIENNIITSTTGAQGVGINLTNSGTLTAGNAANNFTIRNNVINARIRGMFFNFAYGYTVENNSITVGVDGVTGFDTFGILHNTSNTPPANTITVRNNRVFVTHAGTAAQGPTGFSIGTTGAGYDRVVEILNNEIIVENTGARVAASTAPTRGINVTSGISYRIHNNTIWIPNNPAQLGAGAVTNLHGIGGFAVAASNIEILNNVVLAELAEVPAIRQNTTPSGAGSGWVSNYNTLWAANGGHVGRIGAGAGLDLAGWRIATAAFNGDLQSDSFNPTADFTDSTAPGLDLTLNAASRTVAQWGAPTTPLAGTDFQGDPRGTLTYRGFDHLPAALSEFDIITTPASISFEESEPANYLAATLSTDDTDPLASYTYTLVSGLGDTDNASFSIVAGNELRTTTVLTPGAKSVRVRISDGGSLFAEEIINITVTPMVNVQDWMMLVD